MLAYIILRKANTRTKTKTKPDADYLWSSDIGMSHHVIFEVVLFEVSVHIAVHTKTESTVHFPLTQKTYAIKYDILVIM